MSEKCTINTWPESQACMGCTQAIFEPNVEKYGSSAYSCEENFTPDGEGEYGCSKHIESTQEEWESKF